MILATVFSCALLFQIPVPEGFRNFESKTRGLALHIPLKFEEIPIPPDETYVQLKFVEKDANPDPRKVRAEVWVIEIEKTAPVSGGTAAPASSRKIPSWEEYAKQELANYLVKPDGTFELSKEKKVDRFRLLRSDGSAIGAAYLLDQGTQDLILVGISPSATYPTEFQKIFERCAKSLRVTAIKDSSNNEIDAYYRVNKFRNPEYRKKVRRELAKGWKAADTENYILIYDIKDENVILKIKNDLEIVRTKFIEIFPPEKEIEAVSTVRVCKDYDEFLKFSQAEMGVRGYWNSRQEELVFYDASNDATLDKPGMKYTYAVLYHEAFHQYIHYSCGEIALHSWFNEGCGDYFGGSVIQKGAKKVDRVEANFSRVNVIKNAVKYMEHVPLKDFVRLTQKQYYEKDKANANYAQGWGFIYFLNESKAVKAHPVWSKIVQTYFSRVKTAFQEEVESYRKNPALKGKDWSPYQAAQDAAVDAAFKDVNFEELEKAFIDFVDKMKGLETKDAR